MKVLIIGGTGVISRSIVDQLLKENHEVTIFNRGRVNVSFGGRVQQIIGDRLERQAFEDSMKKVECDVVIDMISFTVDDAKSTIRAFKNRVEQIIFTSSVATYKRPYRTIPTIEEAEDLFDHPEFSYAFNKAEIERYLNHLIETEELPITIIRPSLTYGVGGSNLGVLRQNQNIIDRIRKGKPLVMFGDGTTPWSFTFVPDLAKGYVGVVGNKKTYGEAYHITNEESSIWTDLYIEFGKIIGIEPKIIYMPSQWLYKAAPNLCHHLYFEKTYASLFDNSKIKKDVPGFETTITLNQGLKSIYQWYEEEQFEVDREKDELEDTLVRFHDECMSRLPDFPN